MYIANRITVDPNICNGKPTIRGLRVTVQSILEHLSAGDNTSDVLEAYPMLEQEDIQACLKFAADMLGNDFTFKSVA